MKKNAILVTFALLAVLAVLFFPHHQIQNKPKVNVPTEPPPQIYVGAWVGGFADISLLSSLKNRLTSRHPL